MIFLDNASTTRPYDEVLVEFERINKTEYFNPSALYRGAVESYKIIKNAREVIAKSLNANESNIFFTASGSEADNLAILKHNYNKNQLLLCTEYEHSAVYNCFVELKNNGYNVDFIKIKENGEVDEEHLESILTTDTALVSIMQVNNEIGSLNDIKKLTRLVKEKSPNALVHSDGVQSFGKIKIDVEDLGVDLFSISAHKINALKGVGALYVKNPNRLKPIVFGGGQERNIRSGTENVGGISAFSIATQKTYEILEANQKKYKEFKEYIIDFVTENIKDVLVNSPKSDEVNHILNLSFLNVRGEVLVHTLELKDIFVGVGSACSSKHRTSRVLSSVHVPNAYMEGTIRISFGVFNTFDEIKTFCTELKLGVEMLRKFKRK